LNASEKQAMLNDIKNYLDITFMDYALDKKLTGIMERGAAYLTGIAGADLDFLTENVERQLLMDYCRYANANCIEDFERNFSSELLMLRIGRGVADYAGQE
jgi:hypothetical protein